MKRFIAHGLIGFAAWGLIAFGVAQAKGGGGGGGVVVGEGV